jgi:hypothetical protein
MKLLQIMFWLTQHWLSNFIYLFYAHNKKNWLQQNVFSKSPYCNLFYDGYILSKCCILKNEGKIHLVFFSLAKIWKVCL